MFQDMRRLFLRMSYNRQRGDGEDGVGGWGRQYYDAIQKRQKTGAPGNAGVWIDMLNAGVNKTGRFEGTPKRTEGRSGQMAHLSK